jgi:hypothetical protein
MAVSAHINEFSTMCTYVANACWITKLLEDEGIIDAAKRQQVVNAWNSAFNIGAPVVGIVNCAQSTAIYLTPWWNTPGPQLRTRCGSFGSDFLDLFPDVSPFTRPAGNWATLILYQVENLRQP